jgi:predicted RNA-binding protein YlqC (UPF0109 family)
MDKLKDITDTVRTNVKLMVDSPEDVTVECSALAGGATLRIAVSSADLGKIIGKQGRNARALRVLVTAMATAANERISLYIQEQ